MLTTRLKVTNVVSFLTTCSSTAGLNPKNKVHRKIIREKIKNYNCDRCKYTAGANYNINAQEKVAHNKVGDHKCSQCSYAAFTQDHLGNHKKQACT